ncbi:hypothetical protein MLD38_035585 [Melastoma candidum]|uniref:Uncharacterized protein n=1 Tax=Melastoma candidum TaxID=119954 RepID=A0ACB9LHD0_9MYRT|nr:hypothetical protein MLD38_035585 [Melastoma candidum]
MELNEVSKGMAVLVESQREELDDIESQEKRAGTDGGAAPRVCNREHPEMDHPQQYGPDYAYWHPDGRPCREMKLYMANVHTICFILLGKEQLKAMATLKMIDIAVNFTDGMFKGIYNGKQYHVGDIAAVLTRAWAAGVDRIIVTGGSLEESKEALAIAETDGRLYCTVGVHPTRCKEFDDSGDPEKHYDALLSLAREGIQKGKVVAIGECGLDYDRLHFCPAAIQKKYFEKQFDLACATKLPMFLHMRAAADDFCDIMKRNEARFTGGVAHSFTGCAEERDKLLSFSNMFIGINGCSLKTEDNVEVVQGLPVERMMIETDSPYCEIKSTHASHKYVKSTWTSKKKEKHDQESTIKGRNEPCLVRQVLEVIAGCKGLGDINQLSNTLYHNTCRLFFPQDMDTVANAILAGDMKAGE